MGHFRWNVLLLAAAEAFFSGPGAAAFKTHGPRANELSSEVNDPMAMLAMQWGTSYSHVEATRDGDGSLIFTLSEVVEGLIDRKDAIADGNQCVAEGMKITGEESTKLLTMTGVETAEECQQYCKGALDCKAAVFDGASSCELFKSVKGLINSRGSTVVLPTCDHDCFKTGQRYTGNSTVLGFPPNASVCQVMCATSANCRNFTFNTKTHVCSSFAQDSSLEADSHAVSGTKASCQARLPVSEYEGACRVEGLSGWAKSDIFLYSNIDSYEACRRLCLGNSQCNWITYNSNTMRCHLKPSRGTLERIAEADATGPKYCDGKCYQQGVEVVGTPMKTVDNTVSAHFCRFECSSLEGCGMWSYDQSTKKCYLHAQSAALKGRRSANYWTGGPKACGADALYNFRARPCAVRGVRYRGEPLSVTTTPDAQECQYRCQAASNCRAFAFDTLFGKCELFAADAESRRETNLDYISGSRWCVQSCMSINTEGTGTVVKDFPNGFEVREQCELRCRATQGCTFFSFYGRSNGCKLFSSNTTRSTPAVTSSDLECGSN
ncbi:hypothetical protein Emed_003135 [Eimeria media]